MLIQKRTKYRKQHRPDRHGMSKGGNEINFGDFAIQALAPAYVTRSEERRVGKECRSRWSPYH